MAKKSSVAKEKKLPKAAGVLITRVTEDSGADNAGLQAGDVITSINGQEVRGVPALQELLGQLRPGIAVPGEFELGSQQRGVGGNKRRAVPLQ